MRYKSTTQEKKIKRNIHKCLKSCFGLNSFWIEKAKMLHQRLNSQYISSRRESSVDCIRYYSSSNLRIYISIVNLRERPTRVCSWMVLIRLLKTSICKENRNCTCRHQVIQTRCMNIWCYAQKRDWQTVLLVNVISSRKFSFALKKKNLV